MLDDIKKTLWATADKLRANMDAAEYKHLALGLIFLKYISDTFAARRVELTRRFVDKMQQLTDRTRPKCELPMSGYAALTRPTGLIRGWCRRDGA